MWSPRHTFAQVPPWREARGRKVSRRSNLIWKRLPTTLLISNYRLSHPPLGWAQEEGLISWRRETGLHCIAHSKVEMRDLLQIFSTVTVCLDFCMCFWSHLHLAQLLCSAFTPFPPPCAMLGSLPVPFSFLSAPLSSANSIYFFEWIFVTDPLNECLCVFVSPHQVYRFMWDIWGPSKKRWRRKRKRTWALPFIPEVGEPWGFNGKGSKYCIRCDLLPLAI